MPGGLTRRTPERSAHRCAERRTPGRTVPVSPVVLMWKAGPMGRLRVAATPIPGGSRSHLLVPDLVTEVARGVRHRYGRRPAASGAACDARPFDRDPAPGDRPEADSRDGCLCHTGGRSPGGRGRPVQVGRSLFLPRGWTKLRTGCLLPAPWKVPLYGELTSASETPLACSCHLNRPPTRTTGAWNGPGRATPTLRGAEGWPGGGGADA